MDNILSDYDKIKCLSSERSKRFGEVFLLRRKSDSELMVLKTVEKSNQLGYFQLRNEVQFTFKFSGLPEIIEINETENEFYFIKKYAIGISLNDYWLTVKRRKRQVTLSKLVSALAPLFSELKKNGIVHGDVKPENILVQDLNGQLNCAIIDFGLALYISQPKESRTIFQLAYSAPEIILNRLNCADYSTDVFSFCLILYKLLCGSLPFSHSNPALQTQLQITYPIEKPLRIKKKIWVVLEKGLVKHQFRKSPKSYSLQEIDLFLRENNAKRYSDFLEFSNEFKNLSS